MNPEITQFHIIQSKLQQLKKKTPMLIYVITILDIALINFIMIVNIYLIHVIFQSLSVSVWYI
jgi:hypothetical protein